MLYTIQPHFDEPVCMEKAGSKQKLLPKLREADLFPAPYCVLLPIYSMHNLILYMQCQMRIGL